MELWAHTGAAQAQWVFWQTLHCLKSAIPWDSSKYSGQWPTNVGLGRMAKQQLGVCYSIPPLLKGSCFHLSLNREPQPSNPPGYFPSGWHTFIHTNRHVQNFNLKSPSKLWVDKPGHQPFCTFLHLLTWQEPFGTWYWRKTFQLTLLISCSPVSEAVISLQSAWSAGLGKPEKHQQKYLYLFLDCKKCNKPEQNTPLVNS